MAGTKKWKAARRERVCDCMLALSRRAFVVFTYSSCAFFLESFQYLSSSNRRFTVCHCLCRSRMLCAQLSSPCNAALISFDRMLDDLSFKNFCRFSRRQGGSLVGSVFCLMGFSKWVSLAYIAQHVEPLCCTHAILVDKLLCSPLHR